MQKGLTHWADILVIAVYFSVILAVGVWTIFRPQKRNVQTYFLTGRTMPWFAVGASMFAANIGPEVFVGLAGGGAVSGISIVLFEWFPVFMILMLSWVFLPVYISAQVYTLPEYMEKRHGRKRLRLYLSCLSITVNTVSKLATCMFSGTLFIQLVLDWNMYIALAVLIVVTMLFTALGGLKAVIYVGTFQAVMMIFGAVTVMIISFVQIGGIQNLESLYFSAIPICNNSVHSNQSTNSTCGHPRDDAFHIFQDPVTGDQPWPGLVLRASVGEVAIWCCNQVLVQRAISARSLSHAKGGSLLLGVLKLLPLFLMIFPGMISRILFTEEVACTDPDVCLSVCDNPVGCSNMAYPLLIMELLPVGVRGLLLAIMVSAIMTSLTAVFSSESTVFTMDIWRTLRPAAQGKELLVVGKLFTVVTCVIAIGFVPLVKVFQHGRLFNYMVAISGYLSSPLSVLFLLSIFWKRTTEWGALFGLVAGHLLGLSRLVMELMYPEPPCGTPDNRPSFLRDIHYLYFIQIQILASAIVTVIVSLFTTQRSDLELEGVTWWTRYRDGNSRGCQIELEMTEQYLPSSSLHTKNESKEKGPVTQALIDNEEKGIKDESCCSTYKRRILAAVSVTEDTDQANIGVTWTLDPTERKAYLKQDTSKDTGLNILAVALMVIVAFLTGFYR